MPKTRATVKDVTSTLAAAMCERPASFHGLPATASRRATVGDFAGGNDADGDL